MKKKNVQISTRISKTSSFAKGKITEGKKNAKGKPERKGAMVKSNEKFLTTYSKCFLSEMLALRQ